MTEHEILCKTCTFTQETCPFKGMSNVTDIPLYNTLVYCIHYHKKGGAK